MLTVPRRQLAETARGLTKDTHPRDVIFRSDRNSAWQLLRCGAHAAVDGTGGPIPGTARVQLSLSSYNCTNVDVSIVVDRVILRLC
jgi:hypothetical protein